MTSSTTRAFMAKKQSTSFAQVATNLLNVLQGYTKGIRLIAVLTLLLTVGIGNAWGAEVTLTNDDITNLGTTQWAYDNTGKTITGKDGSTWTFDGTYHGSKVEYLQLGQKSGKIHIPTVDGSITKITINAKGSSSGRYLQIEDSEGNHIGDSKLANATQQDYTFNITDQYSQLNIVNHNANGVYSSSNNAIFIYSITVTYETASSYTITAESNNTTYGTVTLSGTTITASPNDGYRVVSGDGGYTVTSGTATVVNNGDNTFTVTPESDCAVQINFEAIPTYTVTWIVNGNEYTEGTPTASVYEGAKWSSLTLPTAPNPNDYCGQVFAGWTTTNIGSTGLDKDNDATAIQNLNLMTSENKSSKTNTITDNITFYAVFADYEQ